MCPDNIIWVDTAPVKAVAFLVFSWQTMFCYNVHAQQARSIVLTFAARVTQTVDSTQEVAIVQACIVPHIYLPRNKRETRATANTAVGFKTAKASAC